MHREFLPFHMPDIGEAEVVLYFHAWPVLVDCQPDTLNLDPDQLEKAISPKTKAVIPVHFAIGPH